MKTLLGLILLFLAVTLLVLAVLGIGLRRRSTRDRRSEPPSAPEARKDS
jgi:Na+-transporting methylmalonyl-CoA/oxaloacetate decarboxylase gamma subunit